MCGVSDDRCVGFSFVIWLFGGSMVGLLVVLLVLLLSSCLAMPGLHCFLFVTPPRNTKDRKHLLCLTPHVDPQCLQLQVTIRRSTTCNILQLLMLNM